jgi:hypothetical protein
MKVTILKSSGLTLVELVVGMGVSLLAAFLVMDMFVFQQGIIDREYQKIDAQRQVRIILALSARELKGVQSILSMDSNAIQYQAEDQEGTYTGIFQYYPGEMALTFTKRSNVRRFEQVESFQLTYNDPQPGGVTYITVTVRARSPQINKETQSHLTWTGKTELTLRNRV